MNAQIIADSINPAGQRITTFILPRFPKCLLAELNTHRMLSRNAASSRAIPLERVIKSIEADPFIPTWTQKQAGMGGKVIERPGTRAELNARWMKRFEENVHEARIMHELGAAKECVNRLLEPWMRVPVIVTATEWDNFFKLRTHESAQADFSETAVEMRDLYAVHEPTHLSWGEWHLPFMLDGHGIGITSEVIGSTAACARVSYTNHNGFMSYEKDRELYEKLKNSGHWSPFEHQAVAKKGKRPRANLRGWMSQRTALGA